MLFVVFLVSKRHHIPRSSSTAKHIQEAGSSIGIERDIPLPPYNRVIQILLWIIKNKAKVMISSILIHQMYKDPS